MGDACFTVVLHALTGRPGTEGEREREAERVSIPPSISPPACMASIYHGTDSLLSTRVGR
jgi:hypothetical protein